MVGLGVLKDITRVSASLKNNNETVSEVWMIVNQEKDSWTQATDIHIIEGENLEFPVNFDDSKEILPSEISLVMSRDNNVLQNLFSRIKIDKATCGKYSLLSITGLE